MYADWLHDLQVVGGQQTIADMFQGAESYLQMWERADGVPATRCLPARERFTNAGLGAALRLGVSSMTALYRAGQPLSRPGRSYRYCVAGGAIATAVFNARGRVVLIASTARGQLAAGIGPGARTRALRTVRARQLVRGVWVLGKGNHGARYVYGVRGGRVRFAALASAHELGSRSRLRADLRAAGL
jgi:hypothetical protein